MFEEVKFRLQVLRRTQGVSSSGQGSDDGVFVDLRGTAVIMSVNVSVSGFSINGSGVI